MPLELSKDSRKQAVSSIERYLKENEGELRGSLAATNFLDFILEEVAPSVYNQAVADVQQRLQVRVAELDTDVFANEFQYWRNHDRRMKKP